MSEKRSGLRVIQPGVHATVQDLGWFGFASQGLSQGGAMDLHAHCWANKLLGNHANCPTIELAVGMATFRAESDLQLAITGADMQAQVDGVPLASWGSFPMTAGQTLTLKAARHGMRAYIGVRGGFLTQKQLGSASAVIRNQLGERISEGELLPAGTSTGQKVVRTPERFIPDNTAPVSLRVIGSCQAESFSPVALEMFYGAAYVLTSESDRMGARLNGPGIISAGEDLISEGIALGAIQIPPNGQPIILLNDRQTLGGYPKIGCVARVDLGKLAQAVPGREIRFERISLGEARAEWAEFCRFFQI